MGDQVRIGVMGAGRGEHMMKYCSAAENAKLVAVCDYNRAFLDKVKHELNDDTIAYDESFDEFLSRDIDAVVLANYATEHVPFAIRCLKAGKHVLSEVLPCQTMAEAVALTEAVEASDLLYAYGENYCYMPAPREMRRLYREGKLGEFQYGEGEYVHNCEDIWPELTQGNPDHWRNTMTATYYCTHSVGPILHMTGLRPVRVTAFELPFDARCMRMGMKAGNGAIEMVELENGALIKSIHSSSMSKYSVWYSVYGTKGRLESAREDAQMDYISRLYLNLDDYEGENCHRPTTYCPRDSMTDVAADYGRGGSDYYTMWNFVEKIRGNKQADTIDVYEALDMGFPGILGYESILLGGQPVHIPNFRSAQEREFYRYDTRCTDAAKGGKLVQPSYSKGNPIIAESVYERLRNILKERNPK